MKLEELKKDLLSKSDSDYFIKSLFKDEKIYARRSFTDLFKYYKIKGVSEVLLMKALIQTGFSARLCNTNRIYVFFKYYTSTYLKPGTIFINIKETSYDGYNVKIKNTKYTKDYLMKLYKKAV